MTRKYWLMKTEPETFSFADLLSRPNRCDRWEGVRNYQARNFMRDSFTQDDLVFIYHSSTAEPAIVGVARVAREAYPDPTALDPESPYFDPKSLAEGRSRWVMVEVEALGQFAQPIALRRLKAEAKLQNMALLRPGQRLSIQPVSEDEWQHIMDLEPYQPIDQNPS